MASVKLFPKVPLKNSISELQRKTVGLCTPIDPVMGPSSVRIEVDWQSYGVGPALAALTVALNLIGSNPSTSLDAIRSVYIDNSDSINPIYVRFPDTDFVAVCPPRSIAWLPVLTNQFQVEISSENFIAGLLPVTTIHLCNIAVSGFIIPIAQQSLIRGSYIGINGTYNSSGFFTANISVAIPAGQLQTNFANRWIMVALFEGHGSNMGVTFGTPTINGLPAIPAFVPTALGNMKVGIYYVQVPTLITTVDVIWTSPQQIVAAAVGAFALYNVGDEIPIDTGGANAGSFITSSTLSVTPFATLGGYVIGGAALAGAGTSSQSFTGLNKKGQINLGSASSWYNFGVANNNDVQTDDFLETQAGTAAIYSVASWN